MDRSQAMIRRYGVVVHGHGVASTRCTDPRFPNGTVAPQLPFFRSAIAEFDAHLGAPPYSGTINVGFGDRQVEIGTPDYVVPEVRWTEAFAAETFLLSKALLSVGEHLYPAFLYIPDPATKPDHVQPTSTVEVLSRWIDGLAYGAAVTLFYSPQTLHIPRDGE